MDTIGPTSKSPVFIRKPVKRSHKLTSYLPPVGQQKKEKKKERKSDLAQQIVTVGNGSIRPTTTTVDLSPLKESTARGQR